MNCPVCGKVVALYRHKDGVHPACRQSLDPGMQPKAQPYLAPALDHAIANLPQSFRDRVLRRINTKDKT